ncbi:hypothetical protein [Pontiella sulfatireligans]|uniref:Uncharacterized protein n=1 Tax=Pontiella sulfatireligans TaxID=2750658 RepID=A0A6C2US92_9BACT|nr:hypothetical protein [Pontiella sulfatireligans]VGO22823.1 hypothetical protein SCARR_04920 [Pontiella sulfatireligans]
MVKRIQIIAAACMATAAASAVEYNFNDYNEGPLDGQFGWNVYKNVKDSSAFSVMDAVGRTDALGDKALVLQAPEVELRSVSGEPVRWMPGETLKVEFDFKVAITSVELVKNRPVLSVLIGDAALADKSRWEVRLEAQTNGNWRLVGDLPDWAAVEIPAQDIVARPTGDDVAISDWFRFVLTIKKGGEPDLFESTAEIKTAAGKVIATQKFTDETKDKRTASIWNSPRVSLGFKAPRDQLGLSVIDNIRGSAAK